MPSQIVLDCSKALADRKMTVAFAESATSGRLAAEFSLCPDSGQVLKGGLVCYDANLKIDILGVSKAIIDEFTPESAEVTKELASKLQTFIPANVHVGITGLTTPGGSESPEKPVGTIFIHALINGESVAVRETFQGEPEGIVLQSIDRIAKLILNEVINNSTITETESIHD
ncbi:CinA family protein [Dyadobacter sp. CY326]|uniref:CinA family protein n=1 Tax=Dyadobacter sp. CY326 TaxID=2907300 RepID=UPI001F3E11D0|nr:nicotinamide-nucleotide amidohydrolase family protein [Dyadobacter sp. CY326]MCE7063777.1 nicotinamide-nucleotide amidohydrolase family protein [Dyadobacter sp. CY326]